MFNQNGFCTKNCFQYNSSPPTVFLNDGLYLAIDVNLTTFFFCLFLHFLPFFFNLSNQAKKVKRGNTMSIYTKQVCVDVRTKKTLKSMWKNDSSFHADVYHPHAKPSSPATRKETHVKKNKRGRCYLLYSLTEDVSHCKRSGCTAPFPFIPLLQALCFCLTWDRTGTLQATLHCSNTWKLPPAWWEKQQDEDDRQREACEGGVGVEVLI